MRLGNRLSLSPQENTDLYHALLLKDSGCSNNAARISQILGSDDRRAKREMRNTDWSRMSPESFAGTSCQSEKEETNGRIVFPKVRTRSRYCTEHFGPVAVTTTSS